MGVPNVSILQYLQTIAVHIATWLGHKNIAPSENIKNKCVCVGNHLYKIYQNFECKNIQTYILIAIESLVTYYGGRREWK